VREVVSSRGGSHSFTPLGGGLTHLRTAIAVASGKGGVGKSTVAVNLAFALALQGARVGVLDADVQGPSLPTMVTPPRLEVGKVRGSGSSSGSTGEGGDCINALESPPLPLTAPLGTPPLALASYGWVSPRNPTTGARTGAALMRGPLLATTIRQLAKFTAWGGRDALVVDTPPGTGDVHLTLGQLVPFTGAVVVTTPQAVACADTDKGLQMLGSLAVPPLAQIGRAHV
jgi:Mrp family chromosome partitioning ATPase